MRDDATVFRLGTDNFRLVGGDERDGEVAESGRPSALGLERVWVKETTDQLHNLAIQGPGAAASCSPAWCGRPRPRHSPGHLRWFRFTRRAGSARPRVRPSSSRARATRASWASRSSATRATGPAVWDAIWEAGAPPRPRAARARRARHPPHRGGPRHGRPRVRRRGRSLRGRASASRWSSAKARSSSGATRWWRARLPPAAAARRAASSKGPRSSAHGDPVLADGQRDRRRHQRDALAKAEER